MELRSLWVLRGPNVWAACPVIEASVDACAWAAGAHPRRVRALERLRDWLPALEKCEIDTDPAWVFARLWAHLQILAGNPVRFHEIRPADRIHRYRVAVEYQEEPVGRECLHAALALCQAAWEDRPYAVAEEIARLRQLADALRLDPTTLALVKTARARDIPVDHFHPTDRRYLLLGHGCRQRRSLGAETEDVSAVGHACTMDTHLTQQLLREAGVPVVAEVGKTGSLHRVLVVEERVVAAARIAPPHLAGASVACLDVTDSVHPETAACAVAAAEALRIRVADIELATTDIARPLEEQGGGVVAVHTGPVLQWHLAPWSNHSRRVGAAIVASLFPQGDDGRIPIVAVTGGRASAAGQCLAALLTDAGYRVGRASRDGVFLAGRKIHLEATTAYEKAQAVLRNPIADVAVLEADARDLMREGFGCDRCDVMFVTDPPEAEDTTDTAGIAEARAALLHALAPDGKVVLNAADPFGLDPAQLSADRILWFAETGENIRLSSHRAAGGTSVFLCGDSLVVARGAFEQRLPFGGQFVERDPREQLALLAALAGAMALNLCGDEEPSSPAPVSASLEPALSAV